MTVFIVCLNLPFLLQWKITSRLPFVWRKHYVYLRGSQQPGTRRITNLLQFKLQEWPLTSNHVNTGMGLDTETRGKANTLLLSSQSLSPLNTLQEEQSVAARHMLGFSMGLLGVCFVLCLAASLTNSLLRRNNWNELDQEHVILLT